MIRLVTEGSTHSGIAAVGVGGAGSAVVNRIIGAGGERLDTISIATDAGSLERSEAMERILIGREIAGGRGCGGDPELGRRSALRDIELVREALDGYGTVVLIGGLGGGTATGALPDIAGAIGEMGIRALSVVTVPLPYEGRRRSTSAMKGLDALRGAIDGVISIPIEGLLSSVPKEVSLVDALFEHVNGSVCDVVRSLARLLEGGGIINADFADVRSVLSIEGHAAIGCGHGKGESRALDAVSMALASSMIENAPLSDAGAVLVSLAGSSGLTFYDVNRALRRVDDSAHPVADIVTGAFVDEEMGDRCSATVIAVGLGDRPASGELVEKAEEPVTWQPRKAEQTVIDFSPPERGRFSDLEPSLYEGEDLDVPTILRRKAK